MTHFPTALVTCIALVVAATTAQAEDNKKGADTKIDGGSSVTKDVAKTPAPPSPIPMPYPTTGTTTTAPAPAESNAKPRDAASGMATGKRQHEPARSP